jgi:hypothetical protein
MKNKGLTFIELIIAVFILGLIVLFLANLFTTSIDLFFGKAEENEIFSNAQIILDRLARDIRQGREVLYLSTNTLTINLSTGVTHTYSILVGADGKKYFALDGQILAGPIENITFTGTRLDSTYTSNLREIRFIIFTLTMTNGMKYSSNVGLRADIPPSLGGIVITEIMYVPPTKDKLGNNIGTADLQFVVIYNNTNNPVDLRGWKINGNLFSSSVTNTWTLYPGKSAVIGTVSSNLINSYNFPLPDYALYIKTNSYGLGSNGIALNSNGDTVVITDSFGRIVDQVTFSPSWGGQPGSTSGQERTWYSMVRKSLSSPSQDASNWTNSSNLNFMAIQGNIFYISYCLMPKLVITEIMYYPSPCTKLRWNVSDERMMEYIEIHNPTYSTISIGFINWFNNYNINYTDNPIQTLKSGTWILSPGSYILISGSAPGNILDYYGLSGINYAVTSQQGLGPSNGQLPNDSFTITLQEHRIAVNNEVVKPVCKVYYNSSMGGQPVFEGSTQRYYSLELKNIGLLGLLYDPSNFASSTKICYTVLGYDGKLYYVYGTPGAKNSVSP